MNLLEARSHLNEGQKYKFVMTLVPAAIWLADMHHWHLEMAQHLGLHKFEPMNFQFPHQAKDPKNFRAGNIQIQDGKFVVIERSKEFPGYLPRQDEFDSAAATDNVFDLSTFNLV